MDYYGTDNSRSDHLTPIAGHPARLEEAWRIDLARGLRQLSTGDPERAEVHFSRAHRRAPEQPEVCFVLGRERLRQGRLPEAERLLGKAWRKDPSFAAAAAGLARCIGTNDERLPEAHDILDTALSLHPSEPGLYVVRAELLLEEDRLESAREAVGDALMLIGDDQDEDTPATRKAALAILARTFNSEGIDLGRLGHNDQALFAFKRAADLDPEWAGPIVNMGIAFAQLGRPARASSCYQRALDKDPENPVALFNIGLQAHDAGDLMTAEAEFRLVLEVDPEYPGARIALANVLLERGLQQMAIDTLRIQLDFTPEDAEVWHMLGVACDEKDELEQAEEHFRRALDIDNEHVASYCHLASVLTRTNRILEAVDMARKATELDPDEASDHLPGAK